MLKSITDRNILFVFVDPVSGNVYDAKRIPRGDTTLDRRTWAIMRLMGTKVTDSDHAEAMMADLWRIRHGLDGIPNDDPISVRMVQVTKGESWIEPATTYHADPGNAMRVVMTVDDDGYVTGFRIVNIR